MSESVNLPALGESVTEGTVTRWLKQVGDRVEVDEPLLEVSTDKVDTEIPSPIAGVIEEILVAEDETAEVGAPLVRIGDGSGSAEALKQHPKVNASYDEDKQEITYHNAEHLAIAVDTDKGLLVPVIADAGNLNLAGLAGKIADVADRTRNGKIGPDELSGGTFSITNIGSVGALFDTPIINQPQVAILGTGAIVKRAVVVADENGDDSLAIRSMMYLSLTYDHRLVDGADAGRFLQTLKARLEEGAFEADLGL